MSDPTIAPDLRPMIYPALVQLRSETAQKLIELERIERRITHRKVRVAWDSYWGPKMAGLRELILTLDAEIAERRGRRPILIRTPP